VKKADVTLPLGCLTGAPLCDREPDNTEAINYQAAREIMDMKSNSKIMVFSTPTVAIVEVKKVFTVLRIVHSVPFHCMES